MEHGPNREYIRSIVGNDIERKIWDKYNSDVNVYSTCAYQTIGDVLNNKDKIVPFALNLGISEASGDYIVRVDSHALYPKNYLSSLYRYSIELRAENVGGVIQTKSQAENKKSLSIARVLFDKFGVGDSKFRVGTSEVCEVDTVPFGFFRRNCLIKLGSLM